MSISFNSAISAYRNAASFATNPGDNSDANSDATSSATGGGGAFSGLLAQPVSGSINTMRSAEGAAMGNLTKQADITDVVTAVTQAETTLKTVVAVRDRLVSAFQELEKMPI